MSAGHGGLRLATRGSALALTQARLAAQMLEAVSPGLAVELVTVRTSGDERPAAEASPSPAELARAGRPSDKSRFVKEIEDALLRGDADLAVHSAKDVPGELPEGLAIVGVPARADSRDALCGGAGSLADLPRGARVGTSSLRRRAQLLAARDDLEVSELRGNVDTRLRRLAEGDYDAVVLARAGLDRLGHAGDAPEAPTPPELERPGRRRESAAIPAAEMTPAAGQGCLALEARSDDARTAELAARLTDHAALVRLTAERAVTAVLEATCRTPIGVHAELGEGHDRLSVETFVGLPDGSEWIRDRVEGDASEPSDLGREAAERLLTAGAGELLAAADEAPEAADRPLEPRGG